MGNILGTLKYSVIYVIYVVYNSVKVLIHVNVGGRGCGVPNQTALSLLLVIFPSNIKEHLHHCIPTEIGWF